MQIFKDYWEVIFTKNVFTNKEYFMLNMIFGMCLGTFTVSIVESNILGMTGWFALSYLLFIEIAKLNKK